MPGAPDLPEFWRNVAGQRKQEERAREHAGNFAGLTRVDEPVVEHGDRRDAEERAVHAADAAKNARAAQHDGGDREEFVTGAGVGLGLPETCGVDDCREGSDDAGEHVHHREAALHWETGVARAFW